MARKIIAAGILLSYLGSALGPGYRVVFCVSGRCAVAESDPCECCGRHDPPSLGLAQRGNAVLGIEPCLPVNASCECGVDVPVPLAAADSHPNGKKNSAPYRAPLVLASAAAALPQAESCPPVCSALSPPRVPPHLPSLRTVVLLI